MSAETTHGQAAHSLSSPDIEVDAKKLFGLDINPVSYTHLTLPTSG